MKNTNVDWIKEIPKNWEIRRLKFCIDRKLQYGLNEAKNTDPVDGVRCIRIRDISGGRMLKNVEIERYVAKDVAKSYLLQHGDVLLARSGSVGKTFHFTEDRFEVCFTTDLIRVSLNSDVLLSNFLLHYTRSKTYENWKNMIHIGAAVQHISAEKYKNLVIPIPPLEEQREIIVFLRKKTRTIDKLLQRLRRMIELLKEENTALITQAVIKGLHSGVKIKSTNVDWIKEIPENWEIRRLKFCLDKKLQYGLNEAKNTDPVDGVRCIRIRDISGGRMLKNVEIERYVAKNVAKSYLLQHGDVLLARSGSVGKTFHFTEDGFEVCFTTDLIRVSLNSDVLLSNFLLHYTRSKTYENWKNMIHIGAAVQHISAEKYKNLVVPIPPLEEQREIIAFLNTKTKTTNDLIEKIKRKIDILQEYRKTLITNVVFGRMKVVE